MCSELITIHTKSELELEVKHLEDLEFDRLIGKVQSTGSPLNDDSLMTAVSAELPHISKQEEMD